MKKKILFILPNLAGGGAEKVIVTLLNKIDRSKVDIYFIALKLEGPYVKDLPEDIEIINLRRPFKLKFNIKFLTTQIQLLKEIKRIKPNVIMTTLTEMNLALLLIKPFLNSKIFIRETNPPSPRWKGKKKKLIKFLYRRSYKRADGIIAISNGVRNDLSSFSYIPKKLIDVIYNPLPIC